VAHLSQHRLAQLLLNRAQQLARGVDASIQFDTQVDSVSLVSFPHQQQQHWATHQQQQQEQQALPAEDTQAAAAAAGLESLLAEDQAAQAYPVCVAVTQSSQQQQQQFVRCRYLVAADGSHSTIRSAPT
jgi:hypothetical protein